MSDAVLLGIVAAVGTVLTGGFGFAIAWLDRRAKRRTAEATVIAATASDKAAQAAEVAADAASEEARAQMRGAIVAEREQASVDWARYCEAQQKWNESLQEQINDNAHRIANTELRLLEAEERAHNWEKLYRKASIYLRRLLIWINENLPGEAYPLPPPELDLDL